MRAEVIAGFVNALFLLFVAFFIFAEAIEVSFRYTYDAVHIGGPLCGSEVNCEGVWSSINGLFMC